MKRVLIFWIITHFSLINYGQIIADHTVVEKFDDIPQYYIDEVKKMWLSYAGESHAQAIRTGLTRLETYYPIYAVNATESETPEAYTASHLRVSSATWGDYSNSTGWIYLYGEEDWFTNATALSRTKAGIAYCNTTGPKLNAIGFGWCWDESMPIYSTTTDPVYGCRWAGVTSNGPEGNHPWGLDAADYAITGNSVCMDTYLNATQQYIDYCTAKGYNTKVFFTTGPVDQYYNTGEAGYQASLKHKHIRDYVAKDPTRILFDYADILCHDDNGAPNTATWSGHTFSIITATNLTPTTYGHISPAGSERLAKAMWWMLARIAGWDGTPVEVTEMSNKSGSIRKIVTSQEIEIKLGDGFISWNASLFDFQGMLVSCKPVENDILVFDISLLSPGIYFVVLWNGKTHLVVKVIKP